MATTVRDLQGQRSLIIDARESTVFLDGEEFCYEVDKGLLLNALRKELAHVFARYTEDCNCGTCNFALTGNMAPVGFP